MCMSRISFSILHGVFRIVQIARDQNAQTNRTPASLPATKFIDVLVYAVWRRFRGRPLTPQARRENRSLLINIAIYIRSVAVLRFRLGLGAGERSSELLVDWYLNCCCLFFNIFFWLRAESWIVILFRIAWFSRVFNVRSLVIFVVVGLTRAGFLPHIVNCLLTTRDEIKWARRANSFNHSTTNVCYAARMHPW